MLHMWCHSIHRHVSFLAGIDWSAGGPSEACSPRVSGFGQGLDPRLPHHISAPDWQQLRREGGRRGAGRGPGHPLGHPGSGGPGPAGAAATPLQRPPPSDPSPSTAPPLPLLHPFQKWSCAWQGGRQLTRERACGGSHASAGGIRRVWRGQHRKGRWGAGAGQGAPYGYTPFCDNNKEMDGFRFWRTGFWKSHLRGKPYHISALYVIDLVRFR